MQRFATVTASALLWIAAVASTAAEDGIRPYRQNPWYWQYHGEPVLLLGGSKDDNLFQIPDLVEHLDEIAAIGGNYVRNTMSDRRIGGFEVYPFAQLPNGKYDLNQWNPEYWARFERLLAETHKRKIFVQIEVWDRFDYAREHWESSPYNPKNNVNYTYAESGFRRHYPEHPGQNRQPFFFTTPLQRNNRVVLPFQERFVRKLLAHSLNYDHVLYCIDNETSGDPAWGAYWARFIKREAARRNRTVYVTEMWDAWDLRAPQHRRTFDHPELYDYVDVSQNNHQKDQVHWDRFQWARRYLMRARVRPMNTVKTYGADGGRFGNSRDGIERWWRSLIGGAAAVRFHRPPSGLGLSDPAKACIRTARMIERLVPFWDLTPELRLLADRGPDEAYLAASPGYAYVVYFPDGGAVRLDLTKHPGRYELHWFDVLAARRAAMQRVEGGRQTPLEPPANGHWVAVVVRQRVPRRSE